MKWKPVYAPDGPGGGDGGGAVATAPWGTVAEGQSWNIGEGAAAKPWYSFLPEGPERQLIESKKPATPAALAKSYYELNRTASTANNTNTVVIPGEGATDADRNAFQMKLGRPVDPSGYKDVQWGENANPEMVTFGTNLAFKLGLSPAQATALATEWNAFNTTFGEQAATTEQAANEQAMNTLKSEWKGDWNADRAAGDRVLTALKANGVSEEDLSAVEKSVGLAPMVRILATIGKLSGESGFVTTATTNGTDPDTMTPEAAAAEVTRLATDKDFQEAYGKKSHPGHAAALDRMTKLYAKGGSKIQL